jgi:hypothetical protein
MLGPAGRYRCGRDRSCALVSYPVPERTAAVNDPDVSWRGLAITQANLISIASRAAAEFECRTCGRAPCSSPSFCKLCRGSDRNAGKARADAERAHEPYRGAAPSTVEALCCALRQGPKALECVDNARRLKELNEPQLREIFDRVQRFRDDLQHEGKEATRWTPEQARALIDKWMEIQHGQTA